MIVEKSRLTLKAAIFSTIAIAIELYAYRENFSTITTSDGLTTIGMALGVALILPHIAMFMLACLFAWIGYGTDVSGLTLTAGILHCVALVFGLQNWYFVALPLILSFTGYAEQKRIREEIIDRNNHPELYENTPSDSCIADENGNDCYVQTDESNVSLSGVGEKLLWILAAVLGVIVFFSAISMMLGHSITG